MNQPEDRLGKCGEETCEEIEERSDDSLIAEDELINAFEVMTYPNPTANEFNVQVVSSSDETVNIQVSDLQARLIFNKSGQQATYHFGQEFATRMYVVVVTQGESREVMRLVKQ